MLSRYRPKHVQLSSRGQSRPFIVAVLPVIVVGGAAAFAYITWSQVREKRKLREAGEAAASKPEETKVEGEEASK